MGGLRRSQVSIFNRLVSKNGGSRTNSDGLDGQTAWRQKKLKSSHTNGLFCTKGNKIVCKTKSFVPWIVLLNNIIYPISRLRQIREFRKVFLAWPSVWGNNTPFLQYWMQKTDILKFMLMVCGTMKVNCLFQQHKMQYMGYLQQFCGKEDKIFDESLWGL